MMIVLHAVLALMNVRLEQFPKATFIKLIPKPVPIAAPAQMYALLKQFILHSHQIS